MPLSLSPVDTVVIGAGAAGLAAAAELSAHGQAVCVLDARERIGGRIHTVYEPDLPIPIELGAEFIHGQSAAIQTWLQRANTVMIDAARSRWALQNGKLLLSNDLFDEMKRGLARVRRPRKDIPFSEFLDGPARSKLSRRAREFARTLVEGFDAADATRVSTLQTLDEWSGASAADAPTFRPWQGYGSLVRAIERALDLGKVQLRLNSTVREVRWRRGDVLIEGTHLGEPFSIAAPRAVVALPLGVLQLPAQAPGAVRFAPALTQKRTALAGLASGPVIKMTLRFRTAFWEELDGGKYRNGSFFHVPDGAFPTFWSTLPLRTPLLVAWTAGPNAARFAGLSQGEIAVRAVESLDALFGKRANVRARLQGTYVHDWQADLFACGAYSYVVAGGAGARKALAAPIQNTLFFAGEATHVEGAATVGGALDSGVRAAKEVMKVARIKR